MSVHSVTARGRAAARTLMTTPVHVYTATETVDPDTLTKTTTTVTSYRGPGRITFRTTAVSDRDPASQAVAAQQGLLTIPADATHTIRTDDRVDAAGRTYRITGARPGALQTAQRFPIELIT